MLLSGDFIGVKEKTNVYKVEKKFTMEGIKKATLKATALGLYFAEINGVRVGDFRMTPGWTSYDKMLQVQTYDVTDLIKTGENVFSLTVGNGWYCSGLSWILEQKKYYGEQSFVCADLMLDDKIISTDESWEAKESYIRFSGIYDGEIWDFSADIKPLTVISVNYDKTKLVEQISEPVRDIERVPVVKIIETPKGELVYDFGQNLTGVVEIVTPEDFDGTIKLQFGELLVNGNFYRDNLRTAKAAETFTVKGKKTLLAEFTFHGFQYMKMEGARLDKDSVTAIVRHTDMKRTGKITVDNDKVQRLLDNAVWSQRDNYLDVPTDCPQRDERLGWTGDANVFCVTAAYNYDVRKIFKKWLADMRNDQNPNGSITNVVPNVFVRPGDTAAIWSDSCIMVPWKLYNMYGDVTFLSDNFNMMKNYIAAHEENIIDGLVRRGHEYGDWLALDKEILIPNSNYGRTDNWYLKSVCYYHILDILTKVSEILGDKEYLKIAKAKKDEILKNIRSEYFTPNGRLAIDTVTAQVLALCFNIVPEEHRKRMAADLNANVIAHKYMISTGFIGTPYVLFALTDNGYFDTARRLLLSRKTPGWLYEVEMGATTIWERWDALQPNGLPHANETGNKDNMNSYNHYAYGSVMEFFYRRIAGIDATAPGFKKVKIAPMPTRGIRKIKCEFESVNGKIVSSYEQKDGKIKYVIEVPEGVDAEIYLTGEGKVASGHGVFVFERECEDLVEEYFPPDTLVNDIFENPIAQKAFNEVFGGIFTGSEIAWMRPNKDLQFMAEFRDDERKMKLSDFPDMLKRANKIYADLIKSKQ